jgi:hypothetical protein
MVIVFDAHDAVTPEGRPVAAPIPVAPVVVWVIAGSAVLMHTSGEEDAGPAVFSGVTDTDAEAEAVQPLLSVTTTVYIAAADTDTDCPLPEGDHVYEAMLAPGLAAPLAVNVTMSPSHTVPSFACNPDDSESVTDTWGPYAGCPMVTVLTAVQLLPPVSVTVTA